MQRQNYCEPNNQRKGEAHIKTVPKLQLILLSRLHKEALGSTSPATSGATQTRQRGSGAVRTKQPADDEIADSRDQER